jgi:hypothetical protein
MRIKTALMHHCEIAQHLERIFRLYVKDDTAQKAIQTEVNECHKACSGVITLQSKDVSMTCICECHKK